MSHPIVTTLTLAASDADGIAVAQVLPGASGLALVLNGALVASGVAQLTAPRRVVITSAGNDSGITFTVAGTRGSWWANTALTEVVTGANVSDAVTTQDFLTVTSVTASGAAAGNVTVGTNGTASGPWVAWSAYATDFQVSLYGTVLSGSPTWEVQYTYDDVFGLWLPSGVTFPRAVVLGSLTGQTGTQDGTLTTRVVASRLAITAQGGGGAAASVQLVQQQQGIV